MNDKSSLKRLVDEYGYSAAKAELVWNKLGNISPGLFQIFIDWWEKGQFPEIVVEGYSFESLQVEHSMNPLAAFLTLDWLTRDPKAAKESLRRGHDKVKLHK
jgi:hypothetical protein